MVEQSSNNTLDTPWIIVIVFSVIIAAQSVFIWMKWYRGKGGGSRPRTEYYELSREMPPRRPAVKRTGYSPAFPQPAMGGRWGQ